MLRVHLIDQRFGFGGTLCAPSILIGEFRSRLSSGVWELSASRFSEDSTGEAAIGQSRTGLSPYPADGARGAGAGLAVKHMDLSRD